jgi:hypothetical protein
MNPLDFGQWFVPLAIVAAAIYALVTGWIWIAGILFVVWLLFAGGRGSYSSGLRGRY